MSTISNERLEKLSEYDCADRYEVMSMATELLALRKERERAAPVAYMIGGHYLMHANDPKIDNYSSALPLYTSPHTTDKVAETAVCQKCGNTGLADSGVVHPWGDPILIDCDCRYASTTHETDTTAQQFESLAGKAVVPEGWKLVPVELTKEMLKKIHPFAEATCLDCGNQVVAHCADNVTASWNDMLAVAPEPCK
ncbi:hypothetical protein SD377_000739 [Cronobacter turicensis]|nr:hypothetical protein [Cronobacter turicensis]EMA1790073.1 hypothetical protein [Cronobacter turicensis]EMA1800137.1 hypothetical protein [Cronobacter turicensis]EMA1847350.1 hypothetical protein [Cronobacter turicensis]EMA1857595.1 hypothetical protein [Cronobacter turicensis]